MTKRLLALSVALLTSVLPVGTGITTTATAAVAQEADVTVDFTTPIGLVDANAFSGSISTYGESGGHIVAGARQRAALAALGPGLYRIPLQWNGGDIVSAAGGGATDVSGDAWVDAIRDFGGTPMIVLGGSSDNNFTPGDGADMVRHFPQVGHWVVGNEPGNSGMSIDSYCTLFNDTAAAMKSVNPAIKVAGPAWAWFDPDALQSFLDCAGSTVDVIDYHHYGMGSTYLDSATALQETGSWADEVDQVQAMINATVPSRAGQIEVQVGEFNWSWRTRNGYPGAYQGDDRFYQAVNTVWGASVAGHIAEAGGRAHQYADQNGALGITFEKSADAAHFGRAVNDPMPIYYGLQMFSGGPFPRFGRTLVQADTTLPDTEVFAADGSTSIVLINKDPDVTRTAVVQTTGVEQGTAAVWQTDRDAPFAAPVLTGAVVIDAGRTQVSLPPYSVTRLVIDAPPPR